MLSFDIIGQLPCPVLFGNSLPLSDLAKANQRLLQEALALHSAGCSHLILDVYHAFEAAPGYADQREWLHVSHITHMLRQALPSVKLGLRVAFGEMEKACALVALGQVHFLCGHTYLQHEDVVHLEGLLRQYQLLDSPVWVQQVMCNSPSEWLHQNGEHPPYVKAYAMLDCTTVFDENDIPPHKLWWIADTASPYLPTTCQGLILTAIDDDQPFQRALQHPSWHHPWPHSSDTLDPKSIEAALKRWKLK
jgi:hypothetical protein